MKKTLLLFIFTTWFIHLHAQQEEYGEFLQNAKAAAENIQVKEFNTNFRYFVAAMYREEITPESLTKENFDLFSECIFWGISSDWIQAEDLKTDIVPFLEYDIENHPSNMGVLGTLYLVGKTVPQDYEKAREWFEKGVQKDDMWSAQQLALMYSTGIQGVEKDMDKAKSYYQKAADLGSTVALSVLATYCIYGNIYGWEKDVPKAVELYKEAIEKAKDYEKGAYMYQLAVLYQYTVKDKKEAKFWWDKTIEHYNQQAEKGNSMAMWQLGMMNQNGYGLKQDTQKAKEWYQKACQEGLDYGCQSYETLNK